MLHDALLYDELGDGSVRCNLCAHRCVIKEGQRGICRVRENREGKLYTLVYGNLISQMPRIMDMPESKRIPLEAVVADAIKYGCNSIAYTYTEPTIFFEFSYDAAKLAKEKGLNNIYVTNGFMTPEMLEMFAPYLDAANVDIKAFRDEPYRRLMGGRLEPVLVSCRKIKSLGIWLEVTTLIVPKMNDDPKELRELAQFIYEDLGPDTPWHLSRFFPQYKMMDRSPTDEGVLAQTKEMGESIGLNYIYLGNVFGSTNTYCKECGHKLIERTGYMTRVTGIDDDGRCKLCGTLLDGAGISLGGS